MNVARTSLLAACLCALALAWVSSAKAKVAPKLGYHSCISCWERVARCESHGNWHISTGNGYYGGLQFSPSTWRAYGGARYAQLPHYASRWQQIVVASHMPLGHWPVCGRLYYG